MKNRAVMWRVNAGQFRRVVMCGPLLEVDDWQLRSTAL